VPILAGFPVAEEPTLPDLSRNETRTLAFRDLDGNYPFASTGREFFFMPDLDGIDLVDPEIITKQSPGMDGEMITEIRTPKRELFLPLWLASDSTHLRYLEQRDALDRLFKFHGIDYRTLGGTFDLVASSVRGERFLRCVYTGGMKAAKWPNESALWAKLGISAWAVQPHWIGERWETPVIRAETGVDTFASFPLEFSSSLAIGEEIAIAVEGEVDSWITVDLVGPADTVLVEATGLVFEIPAGLADGETAKVVTDPRYRTALFDGVKDWSRIGPATTWTPLAPGDQTIDIVITSAGANTQAQVSGDTLYRRPW
jgi:hypothetical protein